MAKHSKETETKGWGKENYPMPGGLAFIECDEMKCVGCKICQMACSIKHFGVINNQLSRIQVQKYLLPLPKAIQVVCVQCPDKERECEKACPLEPPAIYFDNKTLHMVIDEERCLGQKCLQCQKACSAEAIGICPSVSPKPFVCDLCDTENNGNRDPVCVSVCPNTALYYRRVIFNPVLLIHDRWRKHGDEKADLIAKRLYPLTRDSMAKPGWR
ncbi:4Fe-4S dicluster domain-containing protein [Chloroflexota bacterium]